MRLLLILGTVLLAGCASQDLYRPATGKDAIGYSETQLAPNRYRIAYNGGTAVASGRTQDYALMRAADLTLQQGNDWFQLASRDLQKRKIVSTDVDVSYVPRTQVYQSCGLLTCRTSVVAVPDYGPGYVNTTERTAYTSQLEIVMGKNPQPASGDNFDAREVSKTLHASLDRAK